MATEQHAQDIEADPSPSLADYAACVITPMTDRDGKPDIKFVHIVDATIVGGIVFFSVLLGQSLLSIFAGTGLYVTIEDLTQRFLTAGLGFGLTFLAQWARYRGIQVISILNGK